MITKKIYICGDSIPYGVGVQNISDSWPNLLAVLLGVAVTVNAQPGENLQKLFGTNSLTNLLFEPTPEQLANQPIFETWNSTEYEKLLIEPIINDARLNGQDEFNNATTLKAAYIKILNEFNRKGCPDSSIILMDCGVDLGADQETNNRIITFNNVIYQLQTERPLLGVIPVNAFLTALPEPQTQFYADDLHYNEMLTPRFTQFVYDFLMNSVPVPPLVIKQGRFLTN